MSLNSGKQLHTYHWQELLIPDFVVDRINELREEQEQPKMTNGYPIFEWSPGIPIEDNDKDHEGHVQHNNKERDAGQGARQYNYDTEDEEENWKRWLK